MVMLSPVELSGVGCRSSWLLLLMVVQVVNQCGKTNAWFALTCNFWHFTGQY